VRFSASALRRMESADVSVWKSNVGQTPGMLPHGFSTLMWFMMAEAVD